jgi:hypothetical protein
MGLHLKFNEEIRSLYWIQSHLTRCDNPMPQQLINLVTTHQSISTGLTLTDGDTRIPQLSMCTSVKFLERFNYWCCHGHWSWRKCRMQQDGVQLEAWPLSRPFCFGNYILPPSMHPMRFNCLGPPLTSSAFCIFLWHKSEGNKMRRVLDSHTHGPRPRLLLPLLSWE